MNKTARLAVLVALTLALCATAFADTVFTQSYCGKTFLVICPDKNHVAASGANWSCTSLTLGTTACQSPSCTGNCTYPPPVNIACGGCGGGGGGCGCYGCCGGCLLMDGD
jgi:hypothetical protein